MHPIPIERIFKPGLPWPAVHIGSQSIDKFHGNAFEQAWEGFHLAGSREGDIVVVRDIDPEYIHYWKNLMGNVHIINVLHKEKGKYLTEVVLEDARIQEEIRKHVAPSSQLLVFFPTQLEQELANALQIPLHGNPNISDLYGTKSGIRKLAEEADIAMSPGFVCQTHAQFVEAVKHFSQTFEAIIVKHDLSFSGYFSKKINSTDIAELKAILNEISGGLFVEGKDVVVVEGWLQAKTSICAHIEISKGDVVISAGWEQKIGKDGISYIGAKPLMISEKALQSFYENTHKLAFALKEKGAVGSYAPDFVIIDKNDSHFEEDDCVLLELNARVPFTAFPLEIVKSIKRVIGTGFSSQHMKLSRPASFMEVKQILEKENLLITQRSLKAEGVVVYNPGLLPWKMFDIVVIADTWERTVPITEKVNTIFARF